VKYVCVDVSGALLFLPVGFVCFGMGISLQGSMLFRVYCHPFNVWLGVFLVTCVFRACSFTMGYSSLSRANFCVHSRRSCLELVICTSP
jgi:hypothetical protein